ncbi:MAG: ABC-type Mn2+/Zn2+ transport system permease subunit [Planctomycetota bacterium]|jgi:ABC-type Mn2+/Zn2+ transport system permease subunit
MLDLPLADLWSLFRWAILSSIVAGFVVSRIGAFLLVRRVGFYGVALPQLAATGVALGLAAPTWLATVGLAEIDVEELLHDPHALQAYLLPWVAAATFSGLLLLVAFSKRKGTESARVAAVFALSSALAVVLGLYAPIGEQKTAELLSGQILTVGLHEFEVLAVTYALVLLLLWRYSNDLVLVSFDPDTARVLGRPKRRLELLFHALLGATVTVGALIVGPLVLFGLLVVPPLAAHGVARSMRGYLLLSSVLGVVAAVVGVLLSLQFDWPFGPAVVLAAGAELLPCVLIRRLRR